MGKNVNRCPLLNLNRRILKIFPHGGDFAPKSPFYGCFDGSPCDRPTSQGLRFSTELSLSSIKPLEQLQYKKQHATCRTEKLRQNPITSARQECNKSCKTCTILADLISIIMCKHILCMNWQLAANHTVAATPTSKEVNTVDNMEKFGRLSDREIERLIEFLR